MICNRCIEASKLLEVGIKAFEIGLIQASRQSIASAYTMYCRNKSDCYCQGVIDSKYLSEVK
jgi:hypothetical protein